MITPPTFCSSGRAISEIGKHTNELCRSELIVIGKTNAGSPVTVCPRCDCLPLSRRLK